MASALDEAMQGENRIILPIPAPIVSSLSILKATFIRRCVNIINGICLYQDWYLCSRMRTWLAFREEAVGREGLAESIFNLLHLDYVRLLCADTPPSASDILNLVTYDIGRYFAVYLTLVKVTNFATDTTEFNLYHGSATDQRQGFMSRQRSYAKLDKERLPKVLVDLIDKEADFEILSVLPILQTTPEDSARYDIDDMRVPVIFIEGLLMVWDRTLKAGGEYEKLMAFGPWSAEDVLIVRRNLALSLQEYPVGIQKTPEKKAAEKAADNAKERAARAARTPEEKAADNAVRNAKTQAARDARTPEEKAAVNAKERAARAARTPKEKAADNAKVRAARAARTPKETAADNPKRSAARAARTPGEKAADNAAAKARREKKADKRLEQAGRR